MKLFDFSNLPDKAPDFDLAALLEAGVHFGHQSSKWHPKMGEYIYTANGGIHIFDLAKTAAQLKIAYNFAFQLGSQGKTLLLVGTKKQARESIKTAAVDAKIPYITARWLGGLLTNWEQVQKSLRRMVKLESGLAKNAFDKLTKYERGQLEKEAVRLARFFDGLRDMKDTPDAIFVVDTVREDIVIKEASAMGVPVIGLVDSNADPREIDIAIPGNDDAMGSIKFIVDAVVEGYKAGKASRK